MKPKKEAGTAATAAKTASVGVAIAGWRCLRKIWTTSRKAPSASSAMGKWTMPGWKAPSSPFRADFSLAAISRCIIIGTLFLSLPHPGFFGESGRRGGDGRMVLVGRDVGEQEGMLPGQRRRGLQILLLVGDEDGERRRVVAGVGVLELLDRLVVGLFQIQVLDEDRVRRRRRLLAGDDQGPGELLAQ